MLTTTRLFLHFMIQRLTALTSLMQLLQSTGNWINQFMSWAATTVSLIHDKLPGQQFSQHLLADIANYNPLNLLLC